MTELLTTLEPPDPAAQPDNVVRVSEGPHGRIVRRVVLVTAGYFPDSRGGAERQAQILAEALARRGVDVTLIAPTRWREAPRIEETSFGRIERYRIGQYPSAGGRHIRYFLQWTFWFRRRITSRLDAQTAVYVFHARLHAFGPALAARRAGAPLLIKLGGGGEASDFAALREKKFLYGTWVQNFLLRHTDCFVANGSQIEKDLAELGVAPARVAVFPNGVLLPPSEELAATLFQRAGNRFIFAGRLVEDKRPHVLVEAALSLSGVKKAPLLVMLGEGPAQAALAARADACGADNIVLRGYVADVYPELLQSDFFVSASMREGQSNALLEAMSAGVIPIIYGASGVEDVVAHGVTGYVVDRSEPDAFAQAMQWALALTRAQREAMAMAARQFAERHIGIDAIAAKTIETIDHLFARRAESSLPFGGGDGGGA